MSRASDGLLESNDYVFLSICRLSGHGVPCPYLFFCLVTDITQCAASLHWGIHNESVYSE